MTCPMMSFLGDAPHIRSSSSTRLPPPITKSAQRPHMLRDIYATSQTSESAQRPHMLRGIFMPHLKQAEGTKDWTWSDGSECPSCKEMVKPYNTFLGWFIHLAYDYFLACSRSTAWGWRIISRKLWIIWVPKGRGCILAKATRKWIWRCQAQN